MRACGWIFVCLGALAGPKRYRGLRDAFIVDVFPIYYGTVNGIGYHVTLIYNHLTRDWTCGSLSRLLTRIHSALEMFPNK